MRTGDFDAIHALADEVDLVDQSIEVVDAFLWVFGAFVGSFHENAGGFKWVTKENGRPPIIFPEPYGRAAYFFEGFIFGSERIVLA